MQLTLWLALRLLLLEVARLLPPLLEAVQMLSWETAIRIKLYQGLGQGYSPRHHQAGQRTESTSALQQEVQTLSERVRSQERQILAKERQISDLERQITSMDRWVQ